MSNDENKFQPIFQILYIKSAWFLLELAMVLVTTIGMRFLPVCTIKKKLNQFWFCFPTSEQDMNMWKKNDWNSKGNFRYHVFCRKLAMCLTNLFFNNFNFSEQKWLTDNFLFIKYKWTLYIQKYPLILHKIYIKLQFEFVVKQKWITFICFVSSTLILISSVIRSSLIFK